jgi:cytochrome c556
MRRILFATLVVSIAAGAAFAQSAAIGQRQEILKGWGAASRPVGPMLRGEAPFQIAPVQAFLNTVATGAPQLAKLFPADSKEGGNTKALPNIWTDNAKFLGIWAKVEADAKAALAVIKDEASFKAEAPKVFGNCGACHNEFRAK